MLYYQNSNDAFLDLKKRKWIFCDNHKGSSQWLDHDKEAKHFRKAKMQQPKIMVTAWWSIIDVIHYSFLESNQIITAEVYCQQLDEITFSETKCNQRWLNERYNSASYQCLAPCCQDDTANLANLGYVILPYPPYSYDLLPVDYHFLKNLDNFLRLKRFRNYIEIFLVIQTFTVSVLTERHK